MTTSGPFGDRFSLAIPIVVNRSRQSFAWIFSSKRAAELDSYQVLWYNIDSFKRNYMPSKTQSTVGFTYTENGVALLLATSGKTLTLHHSETAFHKVVAELEKAVPSENTILRIVEKLRGGFKKAVLKLDGILITETGDLKYKGLVIDNRIAGIMVKMYKEGRSLNRMVPFFKKLMANPDFRVVDQLYDFAVHAGMVIMPNGNLVVYKAVNSEYRDYRTNTFDNRVGKRPRMLRNMVDSNPEMTCSHGLHVGAFPYMRSFHRTGGHIVLCEVNPTHVVSIPVDYNNTKMRVSEYKVIAEYKNFESLESSLITVVALDHAKDFNEFMVSDADVDCYRVMGIVDGDEESDIERIESIKSDCSWEDAKRIAFKNTDTYAEIRIVNQRSGLVEKTYFTT